MVAADTRDTRTRLLRHGRDVYLEGGAAHFSLREVARRVGISAAAVYRHFDHKEALLSAVCKEGFLTFAGYLMRALVEPTPFERLRSSGALYCQFALENPHDYRVIFMTPTAQRVSEARPDASPTFQFLVDRVRECVNDGKLAAQSDEVETAAAIWAHVHGLVSLRLSGHFTSVGDDAAFASFFQASTDRLLRGLAP